MTTSRNAHNHIINHSTKCKLNRKCCQHCLHCGTTLFVKDIAVAMLPKTGMSIPVKHFLMNSYTLYATTQQS